jgi:hypothetical protein
MADNLAEGMNAEWQVTRPIASQQPETWNWRMADHAVVVQAR